MDHLPDWHFLASTFLAVPKSKRTTSFTVPLSSAVLDPVLFAGTDAMPPLFHEIFYHAETYRKTQNVAGSVIGGHGLFTFNAGQVPPYPETIDYYRGTDAGGSLTGQTVMMFAHAREQYTTFLYAGLAATCACIAYDYSLTTLGDTYRASAAAAYAWADALVTDPTANDAYWKGVLNFKDKANWSEAQFQECMTKVNGFQGLALLSKANAAGALYRAYGSSAGQSPYGNFIEQRTTTSSGTIVSGGSGYAVNDIITMSPGAGSFVVAPKYLVTAVDGSGAVTAKLTMNQGQCITAPTNPVTAVPGPGGGSGYSATLSWSFMYTQMYGTIGSIEYCDTLGAQATAVSTMRTNFVTTNPALNMGPKLSYVGMIYNVSPSLGGVGYMMPSDVMRTVGSHISLVRGGGIVPAAYSSIYMRVMQAHCSHVQGANFKGKAFQTGVGPRPWRNLLHQESFKKGTAGPNGILPFGYYQWANSTMNGNFVGSLGTTGVGGDGPAIWNSDNISGQFETGVVQTGSSKMWNPWRGGSSFWEWSPENHSIIYLSEFSQHRHCQTIAMQLWMHGWDTAPSD
jgi:hypothetical protein